MQVILTLPAQNLQPWPVAPASRAVLECLVPPPGLILRRCGEVPRASRSTFFEALQHPILKPGALGNSG